jgi:hypothetical protein
MEILINSEMKKNANELKNDASPEDGISVC